MTTKSRIIFTDVATKKISHEDYQKSLRPYEQQEELLSNLNTWSHYLVVFLDSKGYTDFEEYGTYDFEDWLVWHPRKIESEDIAIKAADDVLRAIHKLHEAMLQDDKSLIANTSIQVGLAVAKAHASSFEKLAISGKASIEGVKDRHDQQRKSTFQEWLKDNRQKVIHCKNVKDLQKIDRIKAIPVTDATIKSWFGEIYPGQLKGGRPKKKL